MAVEKNNTNKEMLVIFSIMAALAVFVIGAFLTDFGFDI
jgi:hypothetical protein